jgi:hypothetical protein
MLILAAAMMLAATPTPPPVLIGGGVLPDDRQWSVTRPSRGAQAAVVRRASSWPRGWSAFAECVIDRESGGSPSAINTAGSGAAGIAQWLPAWRHGLPYNVAARLRDHGMPRTDARAVRQHLAGLPIHKWPLAYQRVGFADQLARPGGWQHWSLPGSRCEGLVP